MVNGEWGKFFFGVETGASLVYVRAELVMSLDQGMGKLSGQDGEQIIQGYVLEGGTGICRFSLFIEAAFITDA